jgi:sRNA-binding carbon storage regulator CsrA
MRSFSFEEGETLIVGDQVAITVIDIEDDHVLLKIDGIDETFLDVNEEDEECVIINIPE